MKKRYKVIRNLLLVLVLAYLGLAGYFLVTLTLPTANAGLVELQAGENLLISNPKQAAEHFKTASAFFDENFTQLRTLPVWVKILTPLPPFRWEVRLLKASHALALAGQDTSSLASSFPHLAILPTSEGDLNQQLGQLLSHNSQSFFTWYNQADFATLQSDLGEADQELQAVPSWVSLQDKSKLDHLKQLVSAANQGLQSSQAVVNQVQNLLGKNDPNPHTIVILFQNSAELRPSGGFIGSYATLTASSGFIRQFDFNTNIYKLDKTIDQTKVPSMPPELQTITSLYGIRDSTVGSGFREDSAAKFIQLYQLATDRSVDSIIFTDSSILEDLLRLTGPLPLPHSQLTLSADTVTEVLAQNIEHDYYNDPANIQANAPKQVLLELIPLLLKKLPETPGATSQLASLVHEAVQRKSLQFWSADADFEDLLNQLQPLDKPLTGNWLKIVNTNLGGMKSSEHVNQKVAFSQEEQTLKNTLIQTITITRQHSGSNVWPDGDNRNYMDIYLPPEANIIDLPESQGAHIRDDINKVLVPDTVLDKKPGYQRVSLWAGTKVGETTSYVLHYTLPLTPEFSDTFTYLKEAGSVQETWDGFGYDGPVNSNLILTK